MGNRQPRFKVDRLNLSNGYSQDGRKIKKKY